ncbi:MULTISPECIES: hypothetical protein [Xanthomonas]|uniref:hypothetical protein n=1 Tax=Xanthomonas TaxID=338 RepID=UPI001ADA135C|nr:MULTISPECIES: hypothetical protein [unclassified Xanthomonas]MBO9873048.1 hypothetical protein [Xanthomonas sp. D-93]WNH44744.1 hypothetical protein PG878_19915 [Xanthomonas sp. A6251]
MNYPQRVIVFLTFLLMLMLNFYTFSLTAFMYKGMWHSLPAKAVEVRLVDSPSTEDAVPVRDPGGVPTGQVVQIEVQNSFYDRIRLLPFWNMGVLALAFAAYAVAEIIHGWRARRTT